MKRRRNLWRLHLPLVLALTVCTAATIVEFGRASDGVGRAWVYTFQWPLFGAFAVWMWVRYRREDRPDRGVPPWRRVADHWRSQVARAAADAESGPVADEQAAAWRDYVADLRRSDPPGGSSPEVSRPVPRP